MSGVTVGASRPATLRRRQVLAGLATGAGVVGTGCVGRPDALFGTDAAPQMSTVIRTVPLDDDPWALRLARFLARQLEAVGIRVSVMPMRTEELLREVLVHRDFDLYVAEHPGGHDPDFLRPLLHSRFADEAGWQNPTGYANPEVDALLDAQRRQGVVQRRATLAELQHAVVRDQPFSVIAFRDVLGAVRTDRFAGGSSRTLRGPLDYLTLRPRPTVADGSGAAAKPAASTATPRDPEEPRTVRVAVTDPRPTRNLNPLAVEFRGWGTVTGLLYDALGAWRRGKVVPWLANSWSWGADGSAVVSLRDGLTWHDGRALTAADVAFTYRFLDDTSLGGQDSPVPTTRFRGRSTLVSDVELVDRTTVRLGFETNAEAVAASALTVPVLPAHVWRERTDPAAFGVIDTRSDVTEALVWNNLDPVGSGPVLLESVEQRQQLTLRRFDDHFLHRDAANAAGTASRFGFDRLRFTVVPSGAAAVELLADGEVDAVPDGIVPSTIPRIGRAGEVQLAIDPARSFYHLGFNVRREPYSDPEFRRAVARLLDKAFLVDDVMAGYGVAAASPLARHDSLAPGLRWDGRDPALPFPGDAGALDVERARDAFRTAGYRYSNDGALLLD